METKNNLIYFVRENKVLLLKKHFGAFKAGAIYKKSHSLNEKKVAPFLAIDSPIHFAKFLKIPLFVSIFLYYHKSNLLSILY